MLKSRILVIMLAATQVTANAQNAQSIPQVVRQLEIDVQSLKTKAFSSTNSTVAPALPTFNNIEFLKGFASFKNSAGKQIVKIGVSDDNSHPGVWLTGDGEAQAYMRVSGHTAELNLLNNDGKTILYLGEQGDKRSGILRVSNANGRDVLHAGTALEDGGGVWLFNKLGKTSGFLGSGVEDYGYLSLSNPSGEKKVDLDAKGGFLRVFNNAGQEVARIGKSTSENGSIWLSNDKGEEGVGIFATGDSGFIRIKGRGNLDFAEVFEKSDEDGISPGSVVSMAEDGTGIALSRAAYDWRVVGVIAGAGGLRPAVQLGTVEDHREGEPVAMAGQVFVRVSAESGAIAIGDLLVASSRPGVAMRASDRARAFGAVVGKALQSYSGGGEGLVRMLVLTH